MNNRATATKDRRSAGGETPAHRRGLSQPRLCWAERCALFERCALSLLVRVPQIYAQYHHRRETEHSARTATERRLRARGPRPAAPRAAVLPPRLLDARFDHVLPPRPRRTAHARGPLLRDEAPVEGYPVRPHRLDQHTRAVPRVSPSADRAARNA